ncbi:MAG: deoxyribose-phosphate aldolase [Kiritimatiellia bacterium]
MTTPREIARLIDHSILNPNQTATAVDEGCRQALTWGVAAVCVSPCHVNLCADILRGSGIATCTVIGFPHGAHSIPVKAYEAQQVLSDGATELDMVINISAAVSEDFDYLQEEIQAVLNVAHGAGAMLKVILETCYLTDIQKIRLCEICVELGVDWVKTSTGFGSAGATVKDVSMMVHRCAPTVQVKAAGGIRDLRSVQLFHHLGCTRIGCSRTADVLAECAG